MCKTSLREFKNTQRLGCPNCYDAFRDEISNIVKRIAPFESHKQDSVRLKDFDDRSETQPNKADKISALRQDMALAVKEERYEDAAKIKKQIQKLESENE